MICNVDLRNKYISNKHDTNSGGEPEHCIVNQTIEFPRGLDNFLNIGVHQCMLSIPAQTYLKPHYGNGVFSNVYLSAGQHSSPEHLKPSLSYEVLYETSFASVLFDFTLRVRRVKQN